MHFIFKSDFFPLLCSWQGESPLDLAKQRKNVWMINHLQEARQAKGYDSPSFLRKLKADKVRSSIAVLLLTWVGARSHVC